MAIVHLYAEHLLNLRQVTVFATLSTPSNEQTRANIVSNGQTLSISHEGSQDSIKLPCIVKRHLQPLIPKVGIRDLSFRFEAISGQQDELVQTAHSSAGANWSASSLKGAMQVACNGCRNLLVRKVLEWKDLPSGGWADMMDLWHCHKPSAADGVHDHAGDMKGYAANHALGPTEGCGLVDASSFYFLPDDCSGVDVSVASSQCSNEDKTSNFLRNTWVLRRRPVSHTLSALAP